MGHYFDNFSSNYKSILAQSTGESIESASFFAAQKAAQLRRCIPQNQPVKTILDYGCGVGMSIPPLRHQFADALIIGSDPSINSLEAAAKEHRSPSTRFIPIKQLDKSQYFNYFDIIFVSCVFHHIEAAEHIAILKKLIRLCSPTGQLAIFEHNPINPVTRRIVRDCPFDEGVTLISPQTLSDRMKAAGWHHQRRKYISFIPPKLKRLIAIERQLGWCPLGGQYFIISRPT